MEWVTKLPALDLAALALLTLTTLRGLWIGVVRESFTLAALAGAGIVVRLFAAPTGAWLSAHAPFELSHWPALLLASAALGIGVLVALRMIGRAMSRWARGNDLGLWDRFAGGLLGITEGALLMAIAVVLSSGVLGRHHEWLRDTHTLAIYDQAVAWFDTRSPGAAATERVE